MTFTNRIVTIPPIKLNNTNLVELNEGKFLGVLIDNKLKFDSHIDFISKKISKSLGIIYRLRECLPQSKLKSLYYTFIYPYLLYCNLAWGGTCATYIDRLLKLQKRVIRIMTGSSYRAHTNELFIEHEILKINEIHDLKLGLYMFNLESRDEWLRRHCYNTRYSNLLNPAFARLVSTQRSLAVAAVNFWNRLPDSLKTIRTHSKFKRQLKSSLLNRYN